LHGQSAGVVAAERCDTMWQTHYNFTPNLFAFGALRYAHDMFSGFLYQARPAARRGWDTT
jgi:uncharacterized protein DUF481